MNGKIEIKVSEDIILELAADAAVPGDELEMVLQFFKSIGQYETDHCGISVAGTLYTGWISAELLKDIILYGEGSLMLREIMEKFNEDLKDKPVRSAQTAPIQAAQRTNEKKVGEAKKSKSTTPISTPASAQPPQIKKSHPASDNCIIRLSDDMRRTLDSLFN